MLPATWDRRHGANVVTALPPGLPARVRYHERLESGLGFQKIVERTLEDDAEFQVHEVGAVERVVTVEGEYAALVVIRGLRGARRARRWIGAVFAGEVSTALDVLAWGRFDDVEQLARELLCGQRFELGARPRQFLYKPPRGWHGLPMGAAANWYPLDFPAHRAVIVVPPASCHTLDVILEACGDGLVLDARTVEPFRTDGGLDGTYVRLHSRRHGQSDTYHRDVIGFAAGSRVYHVRLETIAGSWLDEDRAVLQEVARSVQPLPDGALAEGARVDAFDHWTG